MTKTLEYITVYQNDSQEFAITIQLSGGGTMITMIIIKDGDSSDKAIRKLHHLAYTLERTIKSREKEASK